MPIQADSVVTESNLRFYYKNFCPIKDLVRWIGYEDPSILKRREISLTLHRGDTTNATEIYLRWQTFESFESVFETLCNSDSVPFKFDIGAIYSNKISLMQLSGDFRPVEREIVFDIDMDDYDEFRTCCSDKKVCNKCWRYIKIAVELITITLKEDFGFVNVLWVYSGRRGIHCWVCDKTARQLPTEGRISIIEYLNLISDGFAKKVNLYAIDKHPLVLRAFHICYRNFKHLLAEQNFFSHKTHMKTLLDYVPERHSNVKRSINNCIENSQKRYNSVDFFNSICDMLNLTRPEDYVGKVEAGDFPGFFMEIIIAFSYPRLDVNVTKDMGHLLKSPFCVHAKTGTFTISSSNINNLGLGRICVPLDHENLDKFNPESVPTIGITMLYHSTTHISYTFFT
ncbi:DNA primase small subunit, putative [Theileria annulata]|uniref:DNA primase n=1 Tax=Theileria annulata TaxID=5874 RepID=Q4UFH5_THEAN|nr:DNA primase small subunit, putative [Theileria annulata]CAI74141.1 DNA primase small subunit, putative [Theileria annulata]|eukprot:XP_951873.1 DNA primase small subunit, putative [Theileria annulata]